MLPGPALIRECNLCHYLFKQNTIASGNNFGAKYWTDGAMDAPMLPRKLPFFKCRSCGTVGITGEQKIIDTYETYMGFYAFEESEEAKLKIAENNTKKEKYEPVEYEISPDTKELLKHIDSMDFEEKSELQVRLTAWRYGNDHRRYTNSFSSYDDDEILNMNRILILLPDDIDANLLRIEILREQGYFDEALALVEKNNNAVGCEKILTAQKIFISNKLTAVSKI